MILVIGAGLSGLSTALMIAERGHTVQVITAGIGSLPLSSGILDVLGYLPSGMVRDPLAAIHQLPDSHPYAAIGADNIRAGIDWLSRTTDLFAASDLHNAMLPTPLGVARPAGLLPHSVRDSVLVEGRRYVVVGFEQFLDFPATLMAANLNRSTAVSVSARALSVSLPARGEAQATATTYAREFAASPQLLEQLRLALQDQIAPDETVLLPALGIDVAKLSAALGVPVGEVPGIPPSILGRQLNDALVAKCRDARVDIALNARALTSPGPEEVLIQRAGRVTTVRPTAVVHAAGGLASGAIDRDSYGTYRENIFDLPLFDSAGPATGEPWEVGVRVNSKMRPLDAAGKEVSANLYCVGDMLGGCEPWEEKSGEGIALGSAWAAADAITAAFGGHQ